MKKLAQPTRSFFTLKISWKTSPGWLQLVFHFGTENWADQLKKPPCRTNIFQEDFPRRRVTLADVKSCQRMISSLRYFWEGSQNYLIVPVYDVRRVPAYCIPAASQNLPSTVWAYLFLAACYSLGAHSPAGRLWCDKSSLPASPWPSTSNSCNLGSRWAREEPKKKENHLDTISKMMGTLLQVQL